MTLPDRELTPTELRQLCESNARSIMALTEAVNETNRGIAQLGGLMEQYFHYQAQTNRFMQEGLEEHQVRLDRIDPQN